MRLALLLLVVAVFVGIFRLLHVTNVWAGLGLMVLFVLLLLVWIVAPAFRRHGTRP